jgi:alcohol/geraniol dehydrogenase (NADP+)
MSQTIQAYAAHQAGGTFERFQYTTPDLPPDAVDIAVDYCGICHSDLSMWQNHWQMTQYPFVPGHEVTGHVKAVGDRVQHLAAGQSVGLGWFSRSCLTCSECMGGDHNLCASNEGTILARHGGFADTVRAQAQWVTPLPEGVNPATAGPLFCGGATVFNPILQHSLSPTSRVGVVGIGGLGHLALQFLNKWGCHVTAFSRGRSKEAEARALGAHDFADTSSAEDYSSRGASLDLLLVTVNAALDWDTLIGCLRPKGVLHLVGAAATISAQVFPLILGQKSISASPVASPATTARMLEFCARHDIQPQIESFNMSHVNEAMDRLENGSPRYRIVLRNDL